MHDYVPSTLMDTGTAVMNKTQSWYQRTHPLEEIHKEIILRRGRKNSNIPQHVEVSRSGTQLSPMSKLSFSQGTLPGGGQPLE